MPRKKKIEIDSLLGQLIVKCIDNDGVGNQLTVGKEYVVLEVFPSFGKYDSYRIKTDRNRKQLFSSGFFEKIK